jgi:CRISPR-associated endonuclease/helicase Cas3
VRVAHHEFRKFVEKAQGGAWFFDALEGEWQPARADHVAPGQVYLVDVGFGGYSTELGWTGEKNKDIFPILAVSDQADLSVPRDGQDRDDETRAPTTQSLEEHTAKVVAACGRLVAVLPDARPWRDVLSVAALWHDLGKTHPCFQRFLTVGRKLGPEWDGRYLAKSEWLPGVRHERPHFRHELASALAWLAAGPKTEETTKSLVAYLIATHHGKIRLFLRAMPGEKIPDSPSNGGTPLFARGIWQGDRLLEPGPRHLEIAGIPQSPITLDLTCMNLGQNGDTPSWIARMLALRDSTGLGIFRLAWLETILRAADGEGSRK